ncbi:MAG: 4Fe-4S cluster-binding domain-containing protein, partial [Candidatus Rifleibacteriota bacterium]
MKQSKTTGNISEIFASIQGEGLHIGTMQLFIRLSGCSLECKRCELTEFQQTQERFSIRPWPGLRNLKLMNPITPENLIKQICKHYELKNFFCVSILGGEPLEQSDFLLELIKQFKERNVDVFVETSGLLADEFIKLNEHATYWCVDLKISKTWGFGEKLKPIHKKIITAAIPKKTYFRMLLDSNDDPDAIIRQLQGLDLQKFD